MNFGAALWAAKGTNEPASRSPSGGDPEELTMPRIADEHRLPHSKSSRLLAVKRLFTAPGTVACGTPGLNPPFSVAGRQHGAWSDGAGPRAIGTTCIRGGVPRLDFPSWRGRVSDPKIIVSRSGHGIPCVGRSAVRNVARGYCQCRRCSRCGNSKVSLAAPRAITDAVPGFGSTTCWRPAPA